MNKEKLVKILKLHKDWLHGKDSGVCANLTDADLRGANLKNADLRGAKIDFSCLPLWCGGLGFKIDERQAKQLVYHIVNLMQYSDWTLKRYLKRTYISGLKIVI